MRFEPHCHSEFSNIRMLDCINKPKDIVKRAKEIGLSGFAITDHEALCGAVRFNKLAKEYAEEGFKMLKELSTTAWLNSYTDHGLRVPTLKSELISIIKKYGLGHLVASTACLGGELSTLTLDLCNAERVNAIDEIVPLKTKIVDF